MYPDKMLFPKSIFQKDQEKRSRHTNSVINFGAVDLPLLNQVSDGSIFPKQNNRSKIHPNRNSYAHFSVAKFDDDGSNNTSINHKGLLNHNPFPDVKSNHTIDTEKRPSVRKSKIYNKLVEGQNVQNGVTSFASDSMMFKFQNKF